MPPHFNDKERSYQPKYPVQTLERAFEILDILVMNDDDNGIGVSELSNRLKIGKSTVHRVLDTLVSYEYVEKTIDAKYRLSWKLFELGSVIPRQRTLNQLNLGKLEELCDKHQETVNLGVREGGSVVIIHKIDPDTTLRVNFHIGGREPFYATALGKVLFSEVSEEKLSQYTDNGNNIKKFTANTVGSCEEMMKALAKVKRDGYAIDGEELSEGLSCIAVPIRNYKNEIVAAISISGPSFRMTFNKVMGIKEDLKKVSEDFSEYLGFQKVNSKIR